MMLEIGGEDRHVDIKVAGHDEVYHVPFMAYMPIRVMRGFATVNKIKDNEERTTKMLDFMLGAFGKYIDPAVLDELTFADLMQIMTAIDNYEVTGVTMGESRASPES